MRREGRGREACLPSSPRSGYGGLRSCARSSSSLLVVLERALMPLRPGGVHVVPLPRPRESTVRRAKDFGAEAISVDRKWCEGRRRVVCG